MRTFSKTLFLLLVVSLTRADSGAMPFFDWLENGAPGYAELRQGAAVSGSRNWIAPRLADGRPVPQASARELAFELEDSAQVPADLKQALLKAFPPETAQFEDHRPQNQAELDRLEPQIKAMEKRLDLITATLLKNVYDRGSNPQASINLSLRYLEDVPQGLPGIIHLARHYAVIVVNLSGQFPDGNYGLTLGGKYDTTDYTATTSYDVNNSIIGISGGLITIGTWQLGFGEVDSLDLSTLVYSGVATPASSQYFNANAELKAIGLMPSGVGPASGLFHLRRIAAPAWYWPFSETQAVFSPRNQFYETWNKNKLYDSAVRLDFAPLNGWIFSDIKPYVTGVNTYNDEAQLRGAGVTPLITQNNRAYAAGVDIALENGSTLLFEGASSDWLRNDLPEAYTDTAAYGLATLPLGDLTLALEASQVGPRFITGGNDVRRSSNLQTGAYYDTLLEDTERGHPRTYAYQTIAREPQAMTNNSRHLAFKGELKEAWATLGLTYSYAQQMLPSGPWVQSHFVLNGLDYNGAGWFYRFGQSYGLLPQGASVRPGDPQLWDQYAFARPSLAPAFAGSYAMGNTYWQETDQMIYHETQTHLLMSQKGLGDSQVLADSLKYTSALKTSLVLDLKPLFNRDLPFDLSANNDLRNTDEQAAFPAMTDGHLLAQTVSDASLRLGLSGICDFLATGGQENWLSRHGFFPVDYQARFYGAGLDFKLDEMMSGMGVQVRAQRFEFQDFNFHERDHSDWTWSIGTGISY